MRARTIAIALGIAGCSAPPPDFHGEEEPVAATRAAISVAEAVNGGCSTTAVWGLSTQIIEQMNCLIPGDAMAEVPERPNFEKGPATLAWMQPPAVAAFVAALDEMPGTTFTSNSMLRTVAQQYLLYRWYQLGTCNISLAATPGTSNHESGLAIDVSQHDTWRATLEAHDFSWLGSSDPVHFDYTGPGIVDLSGADVLAFQQLWNQNHPEDPIAEDGEYGDETGDRLEQSPAEGFPVPPSCGAGAGGTSGSAGATGSGGTSGSAGSPNAGGSGGGSAGASGAAPIASESPEDSSGCSCQLPTRGSGRGEPFLALAGLLLAWLRRREHGSC
jgi:MYXO-CTERM domain-containing protein